MGFDDAGAGASEDGGAAVLSKPVPSRKRDAHHTTRRQTTRVAEWTLISRQIKARGDHPTGAHLAQNTPNSVQPPSETLAVVAHRYPLTLPATTAATPGNHSLGLPAGTTAHSRLALCYLMVAQECR